jgi:hypothetical protein
MKTQISSSSSSSSSSNMQIIYRNCFQNISSNKKIGQNYLCNCIQKLFSHDYRVNMIKDYLYELKCASIHIL